MSAAKRSRKARSVTRRKRAFAKAAKRIADSIEAQVAGARAFRALNETEPLPGGQTPAGVILGLAAAALAPGDAGAQAFVAEFVHAEVKRRGLAK